MRVFISAIIMMVLLSGCQSRMADVPVIRADLSPQTTETAAQAFPVADKVGAPDGLRPCCAFGYDLQAKLGPVPVPFYTIGNVLTAGDLGEHVYNDSFWFGVAEVIGLSNENLGIIYSRHGGFIDIAHVRDTADYTYYLFTQIYPHLGEARMLILSDELSSRRIQFRRFTPPKDPAERYTLSVYLAARLAFRLAAWHEIAQWYGYHSVPGFPEEISAFTPEDLYSNLLGGRALPSPCCYRDTADQSLILTAEWRVFFRWRWHNWMHSPQPLPGRCLTVSTGAGGISASGCRRSFWCCAGITV